MEESALKEAMSMIPMKRMGRAEEVAGLASYLMSDIAGYVTPPELFPSTEGC